MLEIPKAIDAKNSKKKTFNLEEITATVHCFPIFPASVAISPSWQKTQMERSVLCTMPTGQREQVPLSPAVPRRQGTHSALAASGSSPAGHRAQIPNAPAKPGAHGSQRVRAVLGSVPPAHKEQNPWVPAVPGGQSKHVVESADVCWPSPQAWHTPPVPAKPWRHVIHSVWSTLGSVLSGHATHTSEPCRVEGSIPCTFFTTRLPGTWLCKASRTHLTWNLSRKFLKFSWQTISTSSSITCLPCTTLDTLCSSTSSPRRTNFVTWATHSSRARATGFTLAEGTWRGTIGTQRQFWPSFDFGTYFCSRVGRIAQWNVSTEDKNLPLFAGSCLPWHIKHRILSQVGFT